SRDRVSAWVVRLLHLQSPNSCEGHGARISQGRARQEDIMSTAVFVGIDISQARLDVALRPGVPFSVSHDEPGIAAVVVQLRELAPTLIVLEATGALETALTSALVEAAFPVVVANPRQIRDFAKAGGHLAKT